MKAEDIEPYTDLKSDRSSRDPNKYWPNPRKPTAKKPKTKREPQLITYVSVIDKKVKTVWKG